MTCETEQAAVASAKAYVDQINAGIAWSQGMQDYLNNKWKARGYSQGMYDTVIQTQDPITQQYVAEFANDSNAFQSTEQGLANMNSLLPGANAALAEAASALTTCIMSGGV